MKKRYAWLLGVALVLSMTACGSQTQNTVPNQMQSEVVSTTQETEKHSQDDAEVTDESAPRSTVEPDVPISSTGEQSEATPQEPAQEKPMSESITKLKIEVGGHSFTATLEQNAATAALVDMLPLTISMSDYSGFEKVGSLGASLPTSNAQTTTQTGDIVLYNGNQIVIFYGSNSWSYTRLAHVDDLTGWAEALGSGDATVTFSGE